MLGTLLNVIAILIGGSIGLVRAKTLKADQELYLKIVLGAFTVFYGLRLTWLSLNGSPLQVLKQLLIVILGMALGKLLGRLLGLQRFSNHLGQSARKLMEGKSERPMAAGFRACTILFCAAPLGILGAVQDGISGYFYPLAIKAVIEGLAAMGMAVVFRWGAVLSAIPVLAWQGTIAMSCQVFLRPFLERHGLIDPLNAVGGMLVFSVALIILGIKKLQIADYLPSLIIVPTLSWLLR